MNLSLSLWVWETAWEAGGGNSVLPGRISGAGPAAGQMKSSAQQGRVSAAWQSGDQQAWGSTLAHGAQLSPWWCEVQFYLGTWHSKELGNSEAQSQESPRSLSVGVPSLQTRLCVDILGVLSWEACGRVAGMT